MTPAAADADVLVVGAGPAGSACAWALARSGLGVVLAGQHVEGKRGGDTCSPAALRMAEAMGCRPAADGTGLPVRHYEAAWGHDEIESRDVQFWQAGSALAVERPAFDRQLACAARQAGATLLDDCRVQSGTWQHGAWSVQARADGRPLRMRARYVVEACGRGARSMFQPDATRLYADRLVCLHTVLQDWADDSSSILVEACEAGWWYTVPAVSSQHRHVALFTDADLAARGPMRQAVFGALLSATRHVRHRCGGDTAALRDIHVCDARTSTRRVVWRDHWLAIGDAAWTIDPMSGSGIQRCLAEGQAAAAAIAAGLRGEDEQAQRRFALGMAAALQEALRTQRRYYAAGCRWPARPFWQRRTGAVQG